MFLILKEVMEYFCFRTVALGTPTHQTIFQKICIKIVAYVCLFVPVSKHEGRARHPRIRNYHYHYK
jgi:hypothetical protein